MSEQLRHKMIVFEATPPDAVWKTIAARLDDNSPYAALTTRINNVEATPPPAAWEAIAERLNDDKQFAHLTTRMNDFEAIPPPAAWQAITERLNDDRQYNVLATKMGHFGAAPPPQIWNNIADSLQETKLSTAHAPAINIGRSLYRVAAAAIIIGVFAGGWWLISNSNTVKIDIVKTTRPVPVNPAVKEEQLTTPDNNTAQKEAALARQYSSFQNNTGNPAALPGVYTGNNKERVLKYATVSSLPAYHEGPIVIHSAPIVDKDGNVIRDMDILTTSNYINITGPDGQSTRISSKFASVIRYLNDGSDDPEEYLDKVIKESDTWKKRFQEWRSKISQSSFIPSSANFLDIIGFKELIQEKQ